MATGMEPTVSDADRAHFRNVALDNAAVCERSLRDVMARSPGDRVAIALTLSDAHLAGRPSPERNDVVSLPARWHALKNRRSG
jgi:hypothetical protein